MEDINVNKPCEIINSTQEAAANDDDVVLLLRVLAVDADVYSLQYLCTVLHNCNCKVETTSSAAGALKILSANKHGFDIILVDVDSANLNGFKLLETIGLEKDLPVIMVTGDDNLENLTKGLLHGAVDYILKPVGIKEIKNAVHGVVKTGARTRMQQQEQQQQQQGQKNKPRFKWTTELNAKFVSVVQDLERSHKRVYPKKIAEIMDVDGLSRSVAGSHLQKYRLLRKANQRVVLKPTSSITSTTRIKWEKDNYDIAVPSSFNTLPYGYDNYCLTMNMQPPNNVESEPIVPVTTLRPPQFPGECSNPSYLNSAPISPSGWNEPVPNLVSGTTTMEFNRNGETNGKMESSITELSSHNIINVEDEDDDDMISELLDMNFGEGSFNFVSLSNDDDQLHVI